MPDNDTVYAVHQYPGCSCHLIINKNLARDIKEMEWINNRGEIVLKENEGKEKKRYDMFQRACTESFCLHGL